MKQRGLLAIFHELPEYSSLTDPIRFGKGEGVVHGIGESQKAFFAAGLYMAYDGPLLILTGSQLAANSLAEDLTIFFPSAEVMVFPTAEVLPYDVLAHSREVENERLGVLTRIVTGERMIVVAPVTALALKLVPASIFRAACFSLARGDVVPPRDLAERLVNAGYERVDMVEGTGQFSLRGGIVDVFPPSEAKPIRLEFFDEEIDSIRRFDPATQRSEENLESVLLSPARQLLFTLETARKAAESVSRDLAQAAAKLRSTGKDELAVRMEERVGEYLEKLELGGYFQGAERLIPYLYPRPDTLLDYFSRPPLVIADEYHHLRETYENFLKEWHEDSLNVLAQGNMLPGQFGVYHTFTEVGRAISRSPQYYFFHLPRALPHIQPVTLVTVPAKVMHSFHGQLDMFVDELTLWRKKRYRTVILVSSPERGQRIAEDLRNEGVDAVFSAELTDPPSPGSVMATVGAFKSGFELPELRLAVINEWEIFGKKTVKKPARAKTEGKKIAAFTDLKIGDYVVHAAHGIGKYVGVQTLIIGGAQKDYLEIKYAGEDRLYIPTDQMHLIQKYIGVEGHEPKLNKLGGAEWAKTKAKVKESVREMAEELLQLYALRQSQPGHAFSPDTVWQREFEEAFPYEETPDQLRAIEEIKRDMERPVPMDRLLCGDVGYGKTEVAMRAAFKAVQDGKQVAVLVPTTILAQQHFNTFRERFADFPVNIDLLSRFRSTALQKETVKKVKTGQVDIIIGTHRLLQKDIAFKDLGLLIIDEEQRFGVTHKERLKHLKKNVDVLTLTATPIPRTLHMALVSARDMSVIETPPENRFPVQTYVVEHSPELIRDAIYRELSRHGQVFYVTNRVQGIERVAAELQELVPEARIAIGHGQMAEGRLEKVMLEFLEREYDILVCTTIIETGMDIPNVNTLIVQDADKMGLAQLYQLRGRVGRSNRLAYAYFTYRKEKALSPTAEKRLEAIREFTEFGSGFKIAMRDLEIRGAGNILGPEQHGFMVTVGFELYTRLLEQAVRELKGEPVNEPLDPVIEVDVDAYIDEQYIPDARQKIDIYKRVLAVESEEDVRDLTDELIDRFGDLPEPVENLVQLGRLKALARRAGVQSVTSQRDSVFFRYPEGIIVPSEVSGGLAKAFPKGLWYSPVKAPFFKISTTGLDERSKVALLVEMMGTLAELTEKVRKEMLQ